MAVSFSSCASASESGVSTRPGSRSVDLLQLPRVAVGIRERRAAEVRAAVRVEAGDNALARLDVPDLLGVHAPPAQAVAGDLDVVDDQDQALQGAGHGRRARPELDR